jgi:hypothetical protein
MTKRIYLVETYSSHRLLYAITTDKDVNDPNVRGEIENIICRATELQQSWAGEDIESISPGMTLEDYYDIFETLVAKDSNEHFDKSEKELSVVDIDELMANNNGILNETEELG